MSPPAIIAPATRIVLRFFGPGLAWWAVAAAAGFLLISLGSLRWGDRDSSLWAPWAGTVTRWVLFVVGILVVPSLFRVMVAHGASRRTFVAASGAAIAVLGAATGLYLVAGFLAERALYGDQLPAPEGSHLFDSTGQLHLIFAEYAVLAGAYLVSGWLIGAGYLRFGWLRFGWLIGTAFAVAAFLLVVVVELILGTDGGPTATATDRPPALPVAPALVLAVVAIAAGLLAGRWLLATVPVAPKRPERTS